LSEDIAPATGVSRIKVILELSAFFGAMAAAFLIIFLVARGDENAMWLAARDDLAAGRLAPVVTALFALPKPRDFWSPSLAIGVAATMLFFAGLGLFALALSKDHAVDLRRIGKVAGLVFGIGVAANLFEALRFGALSFGFVWALIGLVVFHLARLISTRQPWGWAVLWAIWFFFIALGWDVAGSDKSLFAIGLAATLACVGGGAPSLFRLSGAAGLGALALLLGWQATQPRQLPGVPSKVAYACMSERDPTRATFACRRWIASGPIEDERNSWLEPSGQRHAALAKVEMRQQNWEEARRTLMEALAHGDEAPDDWSSAQAHALLGLTLFYLDRPDEARAALVTATDARPREPAYALWRDMVERRIGVPGSLERAIPGFAPPKGPMLPPLKGLPPLPIWSERREIPLDERIAPLAARDAEAGAFFALLERAGQPSEPANSDHVAKVAFHAGQAALRRGAQEEARGLFERAAKDAERRPFSQESWAAAAELRRMGARAPGG
jgi:tetratricopeptide (TPR) repeat protein